MRALALILALLGPLAAAAQDRAQTLAEIRAELNALGAEIAALRTEMATAPSLAAFGGVSALDRMDAIEAALTSLNARTEALQLRLDRIVADGTNRIADLEFRLTELEGGDVGALAAPAPLGEARPPAPRTTPPTTPIPPTAAPAAAAPAPAAGTHAELDRARAVLGQGDFRAALALLAARPPASADDPLRGEVAFLRGRAREGLGETAAAAQAYLESFTGQPEGPHAPDALFRLGLALGTLGQLAEACATLGEVPLRYPASLAAVEAPSAAAALGCG